MKYFDFPFDSNVKAITTTTLCGNMAYQVGDNHEDVKKNREALLADLNLDSDHLVFVHQTHSDIIEQVTSKDLGKGKDSFESGIDADALYTKEKGIAIAVFHADCEPIFFYDKTIPLVGVIHAGHKGTLKHIAYKSILNLINKEKLNPKNLKVWVGPLRRVNSYCVSDDQKQEIINANCPMKGNNFDVAYSNKQDLIKAGISEENIFDSKIDTFFDKRCYSAYKKTPVGRMVSLIMLK